MSEQDEERPGGPVKFKPGNRWWEARTTIGRHRIFDDPSELWRGCVEYFEWLNDNPLYEDKVSFYEGEATHEPVAHMRAATINGLTLFLGIDERTWRKWGEFPALRPVIEGAEKAIREQKFGGAAAGLLNPTIIARDLGLVEKKELSSDPERPFRSEVTHKIDPAAVRAAMSSLDDEC